VRERDIIIMATFREDRENKKKGRATAEGRVVGDLEGERRRARRESRKRRRGGEAEGLGLRQSRERRRGYASRKGEAERGQRLWACEGGVCRERFCGWEGFCRVKNNDCTGEEKREMMMNLNCGFF
jgi:hypothetical protein